MNCRVLWRIQNVRKGHYPFYRSIHMSYTLLMSVYRKLILSYEFNNFLANNLSKFFERRTVSRPRRYGTTCKRHYRNSAFSYSRQMLLIKSSIPYVLTCAV